MANELNLNQQAATVIRSLMRDLRVSNHIVQVGDQTFSATGVCLKLEGYVETQPAHVLKPVDQTVLGKGNPRANCFQACLAMVLDMPIEKCFDVTHPDVGDWWVEPLEQWAREQGYVMHSGIKAPSGIPYIANGPTHDREHVHGVVCFDGTMFHDPHPTRDGLASVNYYLWFTPLEGSNGS